MDELPASSRLRLVPMPAHDPGRDDAGVARSARCSPTRARSRSCSPARTPSRCWRRPTGARSWSCTSATWSSATCSPTRCSSRRWKAARWSSRGSRTSTRPSARAPCARSRQREERTVIAAPTRGAALALGERTTLLVEAAVADLRRAPPGVGRSHRCRRDRRRGRQVPALDRPDRRGRRGLAAVRQRRRPRGADAGGARPRRPPGLVVTARRARGAAPARLPLGGPRGARAPARAAAVDLRLPAPPRPRAVGLGLRQGGRQAPRA